ncbi:murein biosynthesis integral membrane protein MurJ [Taklimakanibacter lacteus]|uniref:murein biosynthesis integral membrane protein MurJ n=1 Tax=Taklimakanibacter lacteus TaxID=2268456 RepID=UPI000E6683F5
MTLLKSAATVGGLTLVSRVAGFIRDILTASVLGTGPVAQAFVVAFRFPNLFRSLFAEGAFNSAFVPMFAKKLEGGGEAEARSFAEDIFAVMFAWLLFFTAVAQIAMPLLMYVIAPGFAGDADKFDLSVALTRIAFPYLLFMSLTALQSGVLNSLRRFVAAACAPILLNLVMIATLLLVRYMGWGESAATGYALVWGVCVAGIVQFLLLYIACSRANMRMRLKWPKLTPDARRLIRLGIPGVVAGGITQVNILIATMIATTIDRAVSYLYYADRVYQLPLGVVGVAIGVVLLPEMSRKLRAGDEAGALLSQNRSLEFALFLTLPATIALIAIPFAIVNVCFEHGVFTRSDSIATSYALAAFAAGLPAFVINKVFSPGFFAREDTKRPMMFAITSVVINVVSSLILSRFIGHVGIAVSTALAAWVNATLLGVTLARRGHFTADERLRRRLPRIIAASLVMGAMLLGAFYYSAPIFTDSHPLWLRALVLLGLVALGSLGYFLLAHLFGAMKLSEIRKMMRRGPAPNGAA